MVRHKANTLGLTDEQGWLDGETGCDKHAIDPVDCTSNCSFFVCDAKQRVRLESHPFDVGKFDAE